MQSLSACGLTTLWENSVQEGDDASGLQGNQEAEFGKQETISIHIPQTHSGYVC